MKNPVKKVDNPVEHNNPYSCMKRVTGDTHVGGLIRDIVETLHNVPELPFKVKRVFGEYLKFEKIL